MALGGCLRGPGRRGGDVEVGGLHAWARQRPCPARVSGALGRISGVSGEEEGVVLTVELGRMYCVWYRGDVAVGAAAPLPAPRVGALGRVSGASSEGGMGVLTVGLGTPW